MDNTPHIAWDRKGWEHHIHALLYQRFGTTGYRKLPDGHGGDFGIEGFSCDGVAYQCYVPDPGIAAALRYERQVGKITEDIGKFIKNAKDLQKLFGALKIRCWVLATPVFDSAKLMQHAEKQAERVRLAKLSYVAPDFSVNVVAEDAFEKERRELGSAGTAPLHVPVDDVLVADRRAAWDVAPGSSDLLLTLRTKLSRIQPYTPAQRAAQEAELLKHHMRGQVFLDVLRDQHLALYMRLLNLRQDWERTLEAGAAFSMDDPAHRLNATLRDFEQELRRVLPNLTQPNARMLALDAVCDWLIGCSLNFPEGADGHA